MSEFKNKPSKIKKQLINEWHPTKNNPLSFHSLSVNSQEVVWWQCQYGHEWETQFRSRAKRQSGCPICQHRIILKGVNDFQCHAPELAKEWHPSKNTPLRPDQVSPQSNKKVWWLGNCGHEWEATISNRFNGTNCPYCCNRLVLKGFNDLKTIHPHLIPLWDEEKNQPKTPSTVSKGSNYRAYWKCEHGHEWQRRVVDQVKKKGCPQCQKN